MKKIYDLSKLKNAFHALVSSFLVNFAEIICRIFIQLEHYSV